MGNLLDSVWPTAAAAADDDDALVFGYGSLAWKPEPGFVYVDDAFVTNFARRFWQKSPDHRGVPGKPGCVVTLLPLKIALSLENFPKCVIGGIQPKSDGKVYGRVFRIPKSKAEEILRDLDYREKAGYSKFQTKATLLSSSKQVDVLLYSADQHNENFQGPRPVEDIAEHISTSVGPSGPNLEYFWKLHDALVEMDDDDALDEHMAEIAAALRNY